MNPHGDDLEQRHADPVKPPPPPPMVPAGWYPDPDNATGFRYGGVPSMRYFDGVEWTDSRAPMQRNQPRPRAGEQPIIIAQQIAPAPPPVVVYANGTNHGLHAVLTLLTCGMWLPVWILLVSSTAAVSGSPKAPPHRDAPMPPSVLSPRHGGSSSDGRQHRGSNHHRRGQ
jgi:hypothetical protein